MFFFVVVFSATIYSPPTVISWVSERDKMLYNYIRNIKGGILLAVYRAID